MQKFVVYGPNRGPALTSTFYADSVGLSVTQLGQTASTHRHQLWQKGNVVNKVRFYKILLNFNGKNYDIRNRYSFEIYYLNCSLKQVFKNYLNFFPFKNIFKNFQMISQVYFHKYPKDSKSQMCIGRRTHGNHRIEFST